MKTILNILGLLIYASQVCQAQSSMLAYRAEDNVLIQGTNFPKAMQLTAYSDISGGRRLGQYQTSAEGSFSIQETSSNKPAFFINQRTINNPNGSNIVFPINYEFEVENIIIEKQENEVTYTWDALTINPQQISFHLVKCNLANQQCETIQIMDASNSSEMINYSASIPFETNMAYSLQVYKNSILMLYQSDPVQYTETSNKGFTSVCQNTLTLESSALLDNQLYSILNLNGQIIAKGRLENNVKTIDVSNIPQGNYILLLNSKSHVFTKL